MVHEDYHQMGASHQQVSPVFEAVDDGEEFLVIDIVVSFHGVECLGVVSHWLLSPCSFMLLVQDCSGGEGQSVDFQGELFLGVRLVKDRVIECDVN